MSGKNRVIVKYDPFKKEIEYRWYNARGEYERPNPACSRLAREEFTKTTIQNRAYEIVEIVNSDYNWGNPGLEIVFVGTKDDFSDFQDVVSQYKKDRNVDIVCIPDENLCYYNTADVVMPKIKDQFSAIKTTLEQYPDAGIAQLVDKYNDSVKPLISLCVMGLYSAGKSAFINSVIGAEVLPSASDPTTAKVYKISCDTKYEIRFQYDDKECVLTFEGSIYKPECDPGLEIVKTLQDIVKPDGQRDEVYHMNQALEKLNQYKSDEHKISDTIEVCLPFQKTTLPKDEVHFVIYDTPGSNSASNVNHFKVLEDSLDKQANALPIFVASPDQMDSNDNNGILDLIEKSQSLDTTNTIIVVNKADEKGRKTLDKKRETCKNLKITKWKSTRIFFMSSILAIASKKSEPDNAEGWLDEDVFEIYDKNKSLFDNSDSMQLFQFNIVDKSRTDEKSEYMDSSRSAHFYKNSGLEAVEKEIAEYARRYAMYEKCQQASAYLQKAIDLCAQKIQKEKAEQETTLRNVTSKFDSKTKELRDKLEARRGDLTSYNTDFQQEMEECYSKFAKAHYLSDTYSDQNELKRQLKDKWKKIMDRNKKQEGNAFSEMQQHVSKSYDDWLNDFFKQANDCMESFWNQASKAYRDGCLRVIRDNSVLTPEQKRILESVVRSQDSMSTVSMGFNLKKSGAIRKKKFLFWDLQGETLDINTCCEQLRKSFNNVVRRSMQESEDKSKEHFKNWTDSLLASLTRELCQFNSELDSYQQQIKRHEETIKAQKECEIVLTNGKCEIDQLLGLQGEIEKDRMVDMWEDGYED